jgi:O-antigen/teichoic acid export membrane protein
LNTPASVQPGLGTVARHTGWNLAGQALPVVVALLAVPLLIRLLGLERFGFLTLAWALVGYASLFDFGISRALTRAVAQRLAQGDAAGTRALVATAMVYLRGFGLLLAAVLAAASPWLTGGVLRLSPALQSEALHALWLLAASMPFVMATAGHVGVLTAHQRFRAINTVRLLIGAATFVGPVLVALAWPRLDSVVATIVAMRVLANAAYARLAAQHGGAPGWLQRPNSALSRELFAVGGWISVSNFVSPLLTYLDRLLLAAIVPVKAVALYTTPYDLLSRTMMLPYSLTSTLFPLAAGVPLQSAAAGHMLGASTRALFVLCFPLTLAFWALAEPLLTLWLGAEIATGSSGVLRVLALGVLLNALAQAPAMLIQASGNPKWMALLHLAELPLFLLLFWTLSTRWGVLGAALAASLRLGADALAVFVLAWRGVARGRAALGRIALWTALAIGLLMGSLLPLTWPTALAYAAASLVLFVRLAWRHLISARERGQLRAELRAALGLAV